MQTIAQLIADAPIFAGLTPDQLALIAGCARNERAEAGTTLFTAGDAAERFYLIRAGGVALEIAAPARGAIVIETLHDHDVVGWSWLFEPHRWHFDGRVVSPTALVSFDATCLRGKCEEDHELGYQLMRRFAAAIVDRLQATRLQLLDVYANPVAR